MRAIFISFNFNEDFKSLHELESVNNNDNNSINFINYSMFEPVLDQDGFVMRENPDHPDAKETKEIITKRLDSSSKLIVFISDNSHSKEWIKWEIAEFFRLKSNVKPSNLLFVRSKYRTVENCGIPHISYDLSKYEIIDFNIKKIELWINGEI